MEDQHIQTYELPLYHVLKMTFKQALPGIIMGVIFPAAIFLPMDDEPIIMQLLVRAALPLMGFLLLYLLLSMLLTNRSYFLIDTDGFERGTPFGKKVFKWDEIADVVIYSASSNVLIGLAGVKKLNAQRKGWLAPLQALFNPGAIVASIPVRHLGVLDPERIFATIQKILEERKYYQLDTTVLDSVVTSNCTDNGLFSGYIIPFIISIVIGILYGISIIILRINILILPILGCFIIYVYFNKYNGYFNRTLLQRVYLALISGLLVLTGIITLYYIEYEWTPDFKSISLIISLFFKNLINHPAKGDLITAFTMLICMGLGFLNGPVFKWWMKLKELFGTKKERSWNEKDSN